MRSARLPVTPPLAETANTPPPSMVSKFEALDTRREMRAENKAPYQSLLIIWRI